MPIGEVQLGIRASFEPEKTSPELGMPSDTPGEVIGPPSQPPEDYELRARSRGPESVEGVDDHGVILTRLDRPHDQVYAAATCEDVGDRGYLARTGFNFAQACAQIKMVDAQVIAKTNAFKMNPQLNCDTSRNAQSAVCERDHLPQPFIHED